MFLFEAVTENNGVVQRKSQLQDTGNGVGHKRDGTQEKICTHIQDHGGDESQEQHRYFRPGLAGQEQHHHHNDRHIYHDDVDFSADDFRTGVAQVGRDIDIVTCQHILYLRQGVQTLVFVLIVVEGHGVKGGSVGVVGGAVVEVHALDAFYGGDTFLQSQGVPIRQVRHHHLCGTEGGKLFFHDIDALFGFGLLRQVLGQVVLYRHPVPGEQGEDQADGHYQKDQVPFVHDDAGQFQHKTAAGSFIIIREKHPFQRKI